MEVMGVLESNGELIKMEVKRRMVSGGECHPEIKDI
jgi:hypothetical protein